MMHDYYEVQIGTIYKIAHAYGINPAVFLTEQAAAIVCEQPAEFTSTTKHVQQSQKENDPDPIRMAVEKRT